MSTWISWTTFHHVAQLVGWCPAAVPSVLSCTCHACLLLLPAPPACCAFSYLPPFCPAWTARAAAAFASSLLAARRLRLVRRCLCRKPAYGMRHRHDLEIVRWICMCPARAPACHHLPHPMYSLVGVERRQHRGSSDCGTGDVCMFSRWRYFSSLMRRSRRLVLGGHRTGSGRRRVFRKNHLQQQQQQQRAPAARTREVVQRAAAAAAAAPRAPRTAAFPSIRMVTPRWRRLVFRYRRYVFVHGDLEFYVYRDTVLDVHAIQIREPDWYIG